ncbi:MAG: trypsin-like peptidase domain-containing protein [Ruminococcus sp.]|nr:trypsin-like peptidase domain-containing protein [Ruminococcus sp.]
MRNEYDFNIEEVKDETAQEEYTGFSTDSSSPKKPKKHTGAKIAASLMAMALVSAGSIGIYSRLAAPTAEDTAVIAQVETGDTSSVSADAMSLIKTEKSDTKELSNEEIVEKVLPSVVGIESTFSITHQNSSGFFHGFDDFDDFGDFGFGDSQPSTSDATATGTGVIITENGYIVTNAHVIYDSEYGGGLAKKISVLLEDDSSYDAEVIGYDTDCDLAVLKIDAEDLTPAEFGDSDALRLGESVVAIGNPLGFELMDTVTGGMISGLNRDITINDKAMNLIQTDAAINSGNSGGPLINKYGQVIGINSSKMSASYSEASIDNIGFAIPSNQVASIVDDLMKYGFVTGKPQLGISCQDVTETIAKMYDLPVGVYVTAVTEDSAADKAGLEKGDVITAIDGEVIATADELTIEKNKHSAGDEIDLTFIRDGKEHTVTVTLDEIKNEE